MKKQSVSAPDPGAPAPTVPQDRAGDAPAPASPAPAAESDEASLTTDLLSAISHLPSLASETPVPDAAAPPDEAEKGPASDEGEPAPETTTPEPEEPEEAEAEAEDEEFHGDLNPKVKRRFGKLTKKIKALEAQLEGAGQLREERDRLASELDAAKTAAAQAAEEAKSKPEPAPVPMPAGIMTSKEAELVQKIGQLKDVLTRIRQNPNGLTVGETEYTAEQLSAFHDEYLTDLAAAKSDLEAHRMQLANYNRQLDAQAFVNHPWLKDKTDPRTKKLDQIFRDYPGTRQLVGARYVLASAIAWEVLTEQQKAKGDAAPAKSATPPPRQPARPAAAPVDVGPPKPNTAAKWKKFEESGSQADLRDLVPDLIETIE